MKKGFTLIELLTVVVLLSIVSIIATPIITDVIDNAKLGAAKTSADNFAKAARNHYLNNEYLKTTEPGKPSLETAPVADINLSGEKPTGCLNVTYDGNGLVGFTGCLFGEYSFDCEAGVVSETSE